MEAWYALGFVQSKYWNWGRCPDRRTESPWIRWTLPRFDLRGTGWSRQGEVWTTRGAL